MPSSPNLAFRILLPSIALLLAGCEGEPPDPVFQPSGKRLERAGDEISVCGQLFHTGTKVVLWNDPGGFDAYRPHRHFEPDERGPRRAPDRIARYGSFRGGISGELAGKIRQRGWKLEELREVVDLVVLHFDACGTSTRCFEVLHDDRGLSSHFMVDLDGTIYQTLDLKERAWHAAEANDRSVGIEIANIGARREREALEKHYVKSSDGVQYRIPTGGRGGRLDPDFVARPAREEIVEGKAHGKPYHQYDFTPEQYEALEKLLVTLCRVFPRVKPEVPRDEEGRVRDGLLPGPEGWRAHRGLIGHQHLTLQKIDPGPAFDWERLVEALRRAGL